MVKCVGWSVVLGWWEEGRGRRKVGAEWGTGLDYLPPIEVSQTI